MVTVVLFGQTLRQTVEEPEVQCEVSGPTTVRGLLEAHQDKLGSLLSLMNRGELMVTVNRKIGTLDSSVKDGDTVRLTHQFNPTFDGARWHNP
ncbi:MAG: MoaD/ThiS family protein [Nitrospirota bacterium]|jgi:molybdopterin synthase sulfur carrier subunit